MEKLKILAITFNLQKGKKGNCQRSTDAEKYIIGRGMAVKINIAYANGRPKMAIEARSLYRIKLIIFRGKFIYKRLTNIGYKSG